MSKMYRQAFILALCAPWVAMGWTAGEANPDWPHVVAGAKEGTWVAEEGWRFANGEPGDFTVVPVDGEAEEPGALFNVLFEPAKPLTWAGGGAGALEIPPPEGFLSLKPGTALSDYYETLAAANPNNTLLANWVEWDGDWIVCDAYVNEINALRGRTVTPDEFRKVARAIANADLADDKDVAEALDRTAKAANGFLQEMGMGGDGFSMSGPRWLPPHRNEADRYEVTMVMNAGFGGEAAPTANSCGILRIRGRILLFFMAEHAKDADALDEAIAESRRKLALWCDAVAAACRSREGADASRPEDLLLGRPGASRRAGRRPAPGSNHWKTGAGGEEH